MWVRDPSGTVPAYPSELDTVFYPPASPVPAMATLTAFRCRAGSKPAPSPELLSHPQQQSSSSRELHQSWRGQHWPLMWVGACTGAVAGNQTEPWVVPICCFFLAPGSNSAYACSSQVESRFVTALL